MTQIIKFLLIVLLLLGPAAVYAQKPGKAAGEKMRIDSLLAELPKQKQDSNKLKVLAGLSFAYRNSNPEEGLKYGEQALQLATKLDLKKEIAQANNNLGLNYQHMSDYPKALGYYFQALKTDEEIGYKKGSARVMGNIGIVYKIQGDYVKALDYFSRSLKIYESNEDKTGFANTQENIGNVYRLQGDYSKAIEAHSKAMDIYEKTGNKSGILITSVNIGTIYVKQRNYVMAIENFQNALQISEETGNKYQACVSLVNIGSTYISIVSDTARYSSPGLEIAAGKYKQAASKSNVVIPTGKTALLQKGIARLQDALAIANELRAQSAIKECYETLALAYRLMGNYKQSLEYSDKFRAIQDSLFSKENNEKIVKIEMKNEYDRQRMADSLKAAVKENIATMQLQRQRTYTLMSIAGLFLLLGFSFFIVKERSKSEKERKKSDDLLLNILPEEVANELKANGSTTAKHFDNVTVLFTDFVNFTSAGERLSPQQLIDELHTCFKAFDDITGKYGIEKIKTIGDAYLAVAGLPTADAKHAEHMVKAAMEINQFMLDRIAKVGNRTFEIRIGLHSGNVVAGIVGVKKFAYDIWGDTVNTAARIEQNSEAGKINISQTTYELVKGTFTCTYRGEIEAKNKGQLKMYYVS